MNDTDNAVLTAGAIAHQAAAAVIGPREAQHGDKLVSHANIAAMWNAWLAISCKAGAAPLDAHDVATMMEALKIGRRAAGEFNPDDYRDGAGYAACAGEIRSRINEDHRVAKEAEAAAATAVAIAVAEATARERAEVERREYLAKRAAVARARRREKRRELARTANAKPGRRK